MAQSAFRSSENPIHTFSDDPLRILSSVRQPSCDKRRGDDDEHAQSGHGGQMFAQNPYRHDDADDGFERNQEAGDIGRNFVYALVP